MGSYADRHNTRPCMGSHPIQRAADTRRSSMEDMGIDHCCFHIAMSQQLLNGSNVRTAFEQVRGKRMAERMARVRLRGLTPVFSPVLGQGPCR